MRARSRARSARSSASPCRPLGIAALAGLVLVAIGACAAQVRLHNPPSEARLAVLALVLSSGALALQIATA